MRAAHPLFLALLLLLLSSFVLASSVAVDNEDEEEPTPAPFLSASGFFPPHFSEWTDVRAATPLDRVTVFLALKQRNLDLLSAIHAAISDPRNKDYGKSYTREQILEIVAPPAEDVQTVVSWLESTAKSIGSAIHIQSFGDALKITTAAHVVEGLFSTKLKLYKHTTGLEAVRQEFYRSLSLPEEVAPLVEMVTGLSDFPHLRKKKQTKTLSSLDESYAYIIPDTIRDVYSIPRGLQGGENADNIQVALEFTGVGFPSTKDWVKFTKQANETFQNYSRIIHRPGGDAGESTLDVEYLAAIGSNISTWYWTITDGWAYEMALEIFNEPAPHPTVVSVSYAWPEVDTCDSSVTMANCTGMSSYGYVQRANVELQKTGLLRISFLIASADEGAPSEYNMDCSLDRTDHPVFGMYPCSSPYVTCVSGTTIGPESEPNPTTTPALCGHKDYPCALSHHEVPCSVDNTEYQWTTGGGFAEFSVRPSWQDDVVSQYLMNSSVVPPAKKFNNSKQRGYPDVSAVGDRILTIQGDVLSVTAGTSASTPIFAGVVSLLNDYRLSNDKPALGFLNPLLYQMAAAQPNSFNDVTEGNNKCTSGSCCKYGFEAGPGWDAVTGLGTPNYDNMLEYIKTLSN